MAYTIQEASAIRKVPRKGEYRTVRGGSWGVVAFLLRVSNRIGGGPGNQIDYLGFRCAREVVVP